MTTCAIMQPTYLPWSGYFSLIASVDVFVFLDDVQFSRDTWQSKNRILLDGAEHYLTVPNVYAPLKSQICDILVDDTKEWRQEHITALLSAYGEHPWGRQCIKVVERALRTGKNHLADVSIALIEELCHMVGLTTPFVRATSLGCGGRRSEHVALICKALNCDRYLSPAGARDYLKEDKFEDMSSVRLDFLEVEPSPYPQAGFQGFMSHLSIIDVIANIGPHATLDYLRGAT